MFVYQSIEPLASPDFSPGVHYHMIYEAVFASSVCWLKSPFNFPPFYFRALQAHVKLESKHPQKIVHQVIPNLAIDLSTIVTIVHLIIPNKALFSRGANSVQETCVATWNFTKFPPAAVKKSICSSSANDLRPVPTMNFRLATGHQKVRSRKITPDKTVNLWWIYG